MFASNDLKIRNWTSVQPPNQLHHSNLPNRTIFPLIESFCAHRSRTLSTAVFEGAARRTFFPLFTNLSIRWTTVCVLPVPGGPWMNAANFKICKNMKISPSGRCWFSAKSIARFCDSFRFGLDESSWSIGVGNGRSLKQYCTNDVPGHVSCDFSLLIHLSINQYINQSTNKSA